MVWRIHPSREPPGVIFDHQEWAEVRATILEGMVVCSYGHVTISGPAGSWCIREWCRCSRTVQLVHYPAVVAYMLLQEAQQRGKSGWTDEEVFEMVRELGAWKSP